MYRGLTEDACPNALEGMLHDIRSSLLGLLCTLHVPTNLGANFLVRLLGGPVFLFLILRIRFHLFITSPRCVDSKIGPSTTSLSGLLAKIPDWRPFARLAVNRKEQGLSSRSVITQGTGES